MALYALYINEVPVTVTAEDSWSISAPQNGPATFETSLWADDVGGLFATFDYRILLTEDSVPIFAGNITRPKLGGISGHGTVAVKMDLTAHDYNKLASRRYIGSESANLPAGTLKQALEAIVLWIPGTTLADDQVDGPSIEAFNPNPWKAQEALDYLTQVTGYLWRIDFMRKLRMFEPGTLTAPFDILESAAVVEGDVTVEPKRDDYANRVFVSGNGVFAVQDDDDAIAEFGEWELLVQAPDVTTQEAADAMAAAILAAKLPTLKEVRYMTLLPGLEPGQIQTIILPSRGIENTFLITEVNTNYSGGLARRSVTAIEGTVYRTGWRENTRAMFGGGSGMTVSGTGGSGGPANTRYAYPLGGAEGVFVSSPTPTWVDAAPNAVQISTVARGTTSATIVAQLRALTAGVSVQARLFDVTDNVPCAGVSAIVTNTAWQTVTWTVTLTAGAHYYRIQLLPGTANEPVGQTSYLE